MQKSRKDLMLLVCLIGIGSSYCCTTLTPAQKTLWAMNVYMAQYNLYLEQIMAPDLTAEMKEYLRDNPSEIQGNLKNQNLSEAQWKVLKVKKEILTELKHLVVIAGEYQLRGELPPAQIQSQLTDLINRLIAITEK